MQNTTGIIKTDCMRMHTSHYKLAVINLATWSMSTSANPIFICCVWNSCFTLSGRGNITIFYVYCAHMPQPCQEFLTYGVYKNIFQWSKHYRAKPSAQAVHWAQYCMSSNINASGSQGSKHMQSNAYTSLSRSRSKLQECTLHAIAIVSHVPDSSAVSAVYSMHR